MPTLIRLQQTDTQIAGQPAVPPIPSPSAPPVPNGPAGPPGLSAYQQWLLAGNVGTEAQWLASLAATAPRYRHNQVAAATTWTINHNLGTVPQVTLYSAGSVVMLGGLSHPTVNQTIVSFNTAQSGFAICQ
jgi:hypothetical protein